jgi:hypothetical protein
MRCAAVSWVTPNVSRKSSTARSRLFFASARNATDAVRGSRHAAAK